MKKEGILGFGVVLVVILVMLGACGGNGTETFTVGGTVVGLKGTLVLQNNGGDDLTITEMEHLALRQLLKTAVVIR